MDDFLYLLKEYVVVFTSTLLDAIEESYKCMIVPTGPKLKYVFGSILSFTVLTVALQLLGKVCIVKWQDCLVALVMVSIIMSLNYIKSVQWKSSVLYKMSPLLKVKRKEVNNAKDSDSE